MIKLEIADGNEPCGPFYGYLYLKQSAFLRSLAQNSHGTDTIFSGVVCFKNILYALNRNQIV